MVTGFIEAENTDKQEKIYIKLKVAMELKEQVMMIRMDIEDPGMCLPCNH